MELCAFSGWTIKWYLKLFNLENNLVEIHLRATKHRFGQQLLLLYKSCLVLMSG
jgi:hypothetical protein